MSARPIQRKFCFGLVDLWLLQEWNFRWTIQHLNRLRHLKKIQEKTLELQKGVEPLLLLRLRQTRRRCFTAIFLIHIYSFSAPTPFTRRTAHCFGVWLDMGGIRKIGIREWESCPVNESYFFSGCQEVSNSAPLPPLARCRFQLWMRWTVEKFAPDVSNTQRQHCGGTF